MWIYSYLSDILGPNSSMFRMLGVLRKVPWGIVHMGSPLIHKHTDISAAKMEDYFYKVGSMKTNKSFAQFVKSDCFKLEVFRGLG